MFNDIVNAIKDLQTKGIKFNIGFSNDSYWKIGLMVIGVCIFSVGLNYIIPTKKA
jgi:hypothetical protein